MTMDHYIDEKDKELGRARLSQGGEGASAAGGGREKSYLTHYFLCQTEVRSSSYGRF